MAQPKADDKRVNAPTLTDEDFDLTDFLDDMDEEDPAQEEPVDAKPEQDNLKQELENAKRLAESLAAQNDRLLNVIQTKGTPEAAANTADVPPQPDSYDELEAYSDPKSASWKWRVKAEEANRRREQSEMLAAIGGYIDDKLQAQNQVNEIKRMEQDLVSKEKMTPNELEDFRRFLTTQKALDMHDLYQVFLNKTGKTKREDISIDTASRIPNSSDFSGPQIGHEDQELNIDFEKSLLKGVKGANNLF
jgi:hypothetical protein